PPGKRFYAPLTAAPGPSRLPAVPARKSPTKLPTALVCTRCGAAMTEEARFCSQCGNARETSTRRRHRRLPSRVERHFGVGAEAGEPELEVEWKRNARWRTVESSLVNVSRGGLGLVCDESVPTGSRIRASLTVGDETRV